MVREKLVDIVAAKSKGGDKWTAELQILMEENNTKTEYAEYLQDFGVLVKRLFDLHSIDAPRDLKQGFAKTQQKQMHGVYRRNPEEQMRPSGAPRSETPRKSHYGDPQYWCIPLEGVTLAPPSIRETRFRADDLLSFSQDYLDMQVGFDSALCCSDSESFVGIFLDLARRLAKGRRERIGGRAKQRHVLCTSIDTGPHRNLSPLYLHNPRIPTRQNSKPFPKMWAPIHFHHAGQPISKTWKTSSPSSHQDFPTCGSIRVARGAQQLAPLPHFHTGDAHIPARNNHPRVDDEIEPVLPMRLRSGRVENGA